MNTHGPFGGHTYRLGIPAAFASLALALPVQASFQFMQIEQVVGGVSRDTTAQAVQLRMRFAGQNQVDEADLVAFDAAGNNPIVLATFPTSPGPYTVILRGKNNGTGVGVVQAYVL